MKKYRDEIAEVCHEIVKDGHRICLARIPSIYRKELAKKSKV